MWRLCVGVVNVAVVTMMLPYLSISPRGSNCLNSPVHPSHASAAAAKAHARASNDALCADGIAASWLSTTPFLLTSDQIATECLIVQITQVVGALLGSYASRTKPEATLRACHT